jgi:hypothetical protein
VAPAQPSFRTLAEQARIDLPIQAGGRRTAPTIGLKAISGPSLATTDGRMLATSLKRRPDTERIRGYRVVRFFSLVRIPEDEECPEKCGP